MRAMTSTHEPTITVLRGNPSAEEVAALVGALLTRVRHEPAPSTRTRSAWWASGLPGGSRGWRESGLPA